MTDGTEWWVWPLALAVAVLFGTFFAFVGKRMFEAARSLVLFVQNWPQYRRQLVEEEARAGGRHPWWLRALRIFFILAAILLAAYIFWRRFG